ncbi:MAG: gliding motility protein GldL [Sphingobacteriales bacterium]|nr:gliding motility protein GldL [Sphingobacteriales bacterium]MBI3720170.1 gliding motility protein GldL [Sphingobacteriales bacterium]
MLFFKTKTGQKVLNFLFSFFAAMVILGALFKIRHWPSADEMITLGLLAEVIVFLMMAFVVPPLEEYHWERYFPNITEHPDVEKAKTGKFEMTPIALGGGNNGNPALQQMDKMLQDADISPANLKKLSEGFQKFGTTVSQIKDTADVVAATNDYTAKTKEAATALGQMKDVYSNATATMTHFNNAADSTKQFHEQVQVMTKNLGSLNTIYELELQDTNNHLKAMNKFYSNLAEASQAMQGSVEDAKAAQTQIANLAKNLGSLNQIYGNMINAMQGR